MDTSSESPVAVLFDVDGNPVSVVVDGAVRRLQVEASVISSSPLVISSPNVVSTLNTTSTVPTILAPYAGTGESVLAYSEITISLGTTQSALHTGNLYFDFSPDGTNWDVAVPIYFTSSAKFVPFPLRVVMPWFRVRYIPDDDNLTAFRLTCLLHRTSSKHTTRMPSQTMQVNEPVEAVRAVLAGLAPAGTFLNVPTDPLGRLTVNDGSEFSRLINHRIENTEEIRLDFDPVASDHFLGVANDGASESDPVWNVIRIYLSPTKEQTRMRFRQNIRWDERTLGW